MERPLSARPARMPPPATRIPGPAAGGGAGSPAGRAAEFFELLLADAAAIEFERPLVRARAGGAAGAELAELERVKALALAVREAFAARRRRESELTALFDTASDLAALRGVDSVLTAIVRRARQLLGTDVSYLTLNDDTGGHTYMRVTDGTVSARFQALRLPMGAGPRRPGRPDGRALRDGGLLRRRALPAHHRDQRRRPRRGPGRHPRRAAHPRVAGDRRALRRRPQRALLRPLRGGPARLARRARRDRPGQRPPAGGDPHGAGRALRGDPRAAGAQRVGGTGRGRARPVHRRRPPRRRRRGRRHRGDRGAGRLHHRARRGGPGHPRGRRAHRRPGCRRTPPGRSRWPGRRGTPSGTAAGGPRRSRWTTSCWAGSCCTGTRSWRSPSSASWSAPPWSPPSSC